MTDHCVECAKVGVATECQYMEFPAGMHHYFEEKVCTFHHWALYVRPRKGWEEYRKLVELERAAVGYHLTFPSDDVIQSVVVGSHTPQTPPSQKETVQNSVPGDLKAEGEGLHSSDSAAAQATA